MKAFDLSSLRETPLFEEVDLPTLGRMFARARQMEVGAGEPIDNDEGIECFNVILTGRVKMQQTDLATGRSFVPFLLERGDAFDVISLVDGEPHLTMPVAVLPTILLRVPMEEARSWLEIPGFNRAILPYLGRRMRELERFSESVIFDDTLTRLARIILKHARPMEGEEKRLSVEHISHELLAEMIGSVRSVVSTQLKRLDEEGLILRRRGKIIIQDLQELLRHYGL